MQFDALGLRPRGERALYFTFMSQRLQPRTTLSKQIKHLFLFFILTFHSYIFVSQVSLLSYHKDEGCTSRLPRSGHVIKPKGQPRLNGHQRSQTNFRMQLIRQKTFYQHKSSCLGEAFHTQSLFLLLSVKHHAFYAKVHLAFTPSIPFMIGSLNYTSPPHQFHLDFELRLSCFHLACLLELCKMFL